MIQTLIDWFLNTTFSFFLKKFHSLSTFNLQFQSPGLLGMISAVERPAHTVDGDVYGE